MPINVLHRRSVTHEFQNRLDEIRLKARLDARDLDVELAIGVGGTDVDGPARSPALEEEVGRPVARRGHALDRLKEECVDIDRENVVGLEGRFEYQIDRPARARRLRIERDLAPTGGLRCLGRDYREGLDRVVDARPQDENARLRHRRLRFSVGGRV